METPLSDIETGGVAGVEQELLAQLQAGAAAFNQISRDGSGSGLKPARRSGAALCKLSKLAGSDASGSPELQQITPVTLEWRALTYTVTLGFGRRRHAKTVLSDVSGHVQPGELLAVMGPTGGGKSSLLHALAGRLPTGGSLEGEVLVNGLPRTEAFRKITAVCQQDDSLLANLTVRETLEFAANIRLPGAVSREAKQQLVESVLSELGLAKAAGTLVGSALVRGVSGGERKRCYIATELLSNPSLLFLDEPTSGLDAFQAQSLMETLWALAGQGRTVVLSIHQPRSSIFAMFGRLLLLSEGRVVYFGEAAGARGTLAEAGYACPPHFNPADFLLDVASADHRSPEAEAASRDRVQLLAELHAVRRRRAEALGKGAEGSAADAHTTSSSSSSSGGSSGGKAGLSQAVESRAFANNPFREFQLLLGRSLRQARRNRVVQIVTLLQTIFTAGLFAWLWSGMEQSSPGGAQDAIGLLFLAAVTVAMNSMMGALVTFSLENGVVGRERSSKAYRVLPYYLARSVTNMPLDALFGMLFSSILYWATGLRPTAAAFFTFCALVVCEGLAGHSLGVAISAAVPNAAIAMALAPMIVIMLMLFSSFYVNNLTLPSVLRWIKYISHLYYGFMGMAVNEFGGRTGWACPQQAVAADPGCEVTGDEILQQLSFEGNTVGEAIMGLLLLTLGFNILGYAALRVRKPRFLSLASSQPKRL